MRHATLLDSITIQCISKRRADAPNDYWMRKRVEAYAESSQVVYTIRQWTTDAQQLIGISAFAIE